MSFGGLGPRIYKYIDNCEYLGTGPCHSAE